MGFKGNLSTQPDTCRFQWHVSCVWLCFHFEEPTRCSLQHGARVVRPAIFMRCTLLTADLQLSPYYCALGQTLPICNVTHKKAHESIGSKLRSIKWGTFINTVLSLDSMNLDKTETAPKSIIVAHTVWQIWWILLDMQDVFDRHFLFLTPPTSWLAYFIHTNTLYPNY